MKRVTTVVIFIFILVLVQTSAAHIICGDAIYISLPLIILFGMLFANQTDLALISALSAGLLIDVFSQTVFGLNTLLLTALSFLFIKVTSLFPRNTYLQFALLIFFYVIYIKLLVVNISGGWIYVKSLLVVLPLSYISSRIFAQISHEQTSI